MVKNQFVICIDIDDSLLPAYDNCGFYKDTYAIDQFELNVKILRSYLKKKNNIDLFLTSSWSKLFNYDKENNFFRIKDKFKYDFEHSIHMYYMRIIYRLMNEYLKGFFIGISQGSRTNDIIELSKRYNGVIAFDDFNLSNLEKEIKNFKYIPAYGALVPPMFYFIDKFIEERISDKRND